MHRGVDGCGGGDGGDGGDGSCGCGCGCNVMCNLISLSLSLLLSLARKLIGGAEGIFQLMPARIIIISYLHLTQMKLKRRIYHRLYDYKCSI